ncbi:MAG: FecR family protein [Chitinivibrionales bacterium]
MPETLKVVDYSYIVSTFKRNVNWSSNDETWQPVTTGLGIAKGSFVETGEVSAAGLNGTLGDIVMLGEKAKVQLLIEKLEKQADGSSLALRGVSLLKGMARFTVTKGIGSFVVETPSARVKVKGTDFVVTIDEKFGGTDVSVREGLVDVEDKKKTRKTFSLSKGQTLLGAGTAKPMQRAMTTKENDVFKTLQLSESNQGAMPSETKETPEEIKQRLNNQSKGISGKETQMEHTKSQAALENERAVSQHKIDTIRAGYHAATQADKDTFSARKAKAVQTIDSTKNAAQSALDAEREKFKDATAGVKSSSSQSSDDAFDELHNRKSGN